MSRSRPTPIRSLATAALVVGALVGACGGSGSDATEVIVRDPDDQQVLTPAEVAALRADTRPPPTAQAPRRAPPGDTIPLEDVDPTERLFTAFGEFNGCMEDGGQPFRGDPAVRPQRCWRTRRTWRSSSAAPPAATSSVRSTAFQEFNDSLTPGPGGGAQRAVPRVRRSACEERGWTVEAAPDEKGLLTPSVFQSPDGGLNERDLRQCGSEVETDE